MRPLLVASWFALSSGSATAQVRLEGDPGIAYWEVGDLNSARVIIVLHGGPAVSHHYLRPEWESLGDSARVVFYDQRGCGLSAEADTYRWQDHVADLKRLISVVSPLEPVVLAGSSWGSVLALYYTAEHSQDVLALVLSGMPGMPGTVRRETDFLPPLDLKARSGPAGVPQRPSFGSLFPSHRVNNVRAEEERTRMMELLAPRFVAD